MSEAVRNVLGWALFISCCWWFGGDDRHIDRMLVGAWIIFIIIFLLKGEWFR